MIVEKAVEYVFQNIEASPDGVRFNDPGCGCCGGGEDFLSPQASIDTINEIIRRLQKIKKEVKK